jgi:hypothetical protein
MNTQGVRGEGLSRIGTKGKARQFDWSLKSTISDIGAERAICWSYTQAATVLSLIE